MNKSINLEFYKLIFENSLDAIFLTTPDGCIHRANSSACKMFNMIEDEILEAGRDGLIDKKDPRLLEALKYRDENGYANVELTCLKKGKKPFPALVNSSVFKDPENNKWTVVIIRDLTELKETENFLIKCKDDNEYLATHDYMTEILNRRGFISQAKDRMDNVKNENDNCAFLLLDIDNFKEVNDNFGHIKADQILKNFARFLSSNIDNDTLLGRYGGDEFILSFSDRSNKEVVQEAERIRKLIEKKDFIIENLIVKLTVSIGVANCTIYTEKDIDSIISEADTNMYKAKRKRNNIYW
ncbi:MAG: sensor domain-containing diguanylate cyclase [Candidatus Izimaplasma sp.]|nr:sensor domain-containing diguanylate cyclase [Candidatus Izimaplasma bacterium]